MGLTKILSEWRTKLSIRESNERARGGEDATAAHDRLERDALVETEPKRDGESLVRLAPAMYADSQDVPPWWG